MAINTNLRHIDTVGNVNDKIITTLNVLDNQYVNYGTFKQGRSLKNLRNSALTGHMDSVSANYHKYVNFEYKKSLLFSNSALINRAFFCNSLPLIQPILDANQQEKLAMAELIRTGALNVFLNANETNFMDAVAGAAFDIVNHDAIVEYYKNLNDVTINAFNMTNTAGQVDLNSDIARRFRAELSTADDDEYQKNYLMTQTSHI